MRLIDADKLEEHKFTSSEANHNDMGGAYRTGWNDAIDAICDNAPTIDAEPVTRCRDCIAGLRYKGQILCVKDYYKGYPRKAEDFCSEAYPVRKEDMQ